MASKREGLIVKKLRALRGSTSSKAVHDAVGITPSKLSRIESSHVRPRPDDVRLLATFYGADAATVDRLVEESRAARERGWWSEFAGPDWDKALSDHLELESIAVRIDSWLIDLVPGLMQTPDYYRALIEGRPDVTDDQIERRMELRKKRRERVETGDLELWAVLGEGAIRQEIGGRVVLAGQLRYLRDAPANVTVQVLPFSAGAHPGLGTSFHVLRFSDWPSLIYQDTIVRGLYHDAQEDVRAHETTMEHVRAAALSPRQSRDVLAQRIDELED